MAFEHPDKSERSISPTGGEIATMLRPSNQEMQSLFPIGQANRAEPTLLDFGSLSDLYGKDIIAQVHYLDDQPIERYWPKHETARGTNPFADTGKTMDPDNPASWTLPKPENYKGWMPGDPINPLTWAKDASLYIQEIMKENFVVGSDGKRVSIFDLHNEEFKKKFGNAARHALAIGDLVLMEGYDPKAAEAAMLTHEPQSWATAIAKGIGAHSWEPYNKEMQDSQADIQNNGYAIRSVRSFRDFASFAHQMLSECWKSATNGSWVIDPAATSHQH